MSRGGMCPDSGIPVTSGYCVESRLERLRVGDQGRGNGSSPGRQ